MLWKNTRQHWEALIQKSPLQHVTEGMAELTRQLFIQGEMLGYLWVTMYPDLPGKRVPFRPKASDIKDVYLATGSLMVVYPPVSDSNPDFLFEDMKGGLSWTETPVPYPSVLGGVSLCPLSLLL